MLDRRQIVFGGGLAATSLVFLSACGGETDVTFANPAPVWWNAVPLIAAERGFYAREGVNVLGFDVPTGVRSKQAIVDGNAQMGVASPNAISTSTDADLRHLKILATLTQSNSTVAILTRGAAADILNSRIGYVRGAISEFYLIAHLIKSGNLAAYRNHSLTLVDLPPPSLVTAFAHGDIDTAVAWEPFASQILQLPSDRPITAIRDDSLYTQHIFALAHPALSPDLRGRVVTALSKSSEYITQNRAAVAADLERYFRFPARFLSGSDVWDKVNFRFSREKTPILAALNRDLVLAQEAGVARTGGGPPFEELLDQLI